MTEDNAVTAPLRLALYGLGNMARSYVDACSGRRPYGNVARESGVELSWAISARGELEAADAFARTHGIPHAAASLSAALDDADYVEKLLRVGLTP